MGVPLLQAAGVSKWFEPGQPVLRQVSVEVGRGEIVAVLGPSGSGKTTLLRMFNGLLEADEGTVVCDGRPLPDWPVRALRQRVGMLFQKPVLFGGTVRDNLLAPLRLATAGGRAQERATAGTSLSALPDGPAAEARMVALLAGLGLAAGTLDRVAAELSAGQQQRVAFVRALMLSPVAMLLDEPTANLDPASAGRLLDQVAGIARDEGLGVLLVTHQVEHARRIADRLLLLVDGRIAATGDPRSFFDGHDDQMAQFLAGLIGGVEA